MRPNLKRLAITMMVLGITLALYSAWRYVRGWLGFPSTPQVARLAGYQGCLCGDCRSAMVPGWLIADAEDKMFGVWLQPYAPAVVASYGGLITGCGVALRRYARRQASSGTCASCGYDLLGLNACICPECGRTQ